METYTALRHFADSWMLLFMVLFFVGVVFWIYRPGATRQQQEIARSIFEHDDKPAPARTAGETSEKDDRAGRGVAKEPAR